tara:strand:+ start:2108 stop:2299 length:192 start_codon:yes stop_codon:yes gene_type:complete
MTTDFKSLSTTELSERWGVSYKTICDWRLKGVGPPFHKFEGVIRYKLSDILDYEQKNQFNVKS